MSSIKTHDDVDHEVTDTWYAQNVEPFPHIVYMSESQREAQRTGLLKLSNIRPLLQEEEDELQALTRWKNLYSAWRWLGAAYEEVSTGKRNADGSLITKKVMLYPGRHYDEFGFDYLDQVHGSYERHLCGCVTQYCFDHNLVFARSDATERQSILKASTVPSVVKQKTVYPEEKIKEATLRDKEDKDFLANNPVVHHAHHSVRFCKQHQHLKADFSAHYAELHKVTPSAA